MKTPLLQKKNDTSLVKTLAEATGTISIITFLSRILGLVRGMVIARFFGAGFATDAFYVAFNLPNFIRRFVAEGSLATTFVPVFSEELARSEDEGRKAFSAVTTFSLLLTLATTILGIIFADELTRLIGYGFGSGSEKSALTASLMRMMFPYIILTSLLALAASVLNTLGYFAVPASTPAIISGVMILAVVFISPLLMVKIYSLAAAVLVGGVLALLLSGYLLHRVGFGFFLTSPLFSGAVSTISRLMVPVMLSTSHYPIMVIANRMLASLHQEGRIAVARA
ncbi:lipid II flippase MurJ [candidate division CSSED10-310 bacterium]|uniref:Lipid II flippase MurJ n=1 Tax=candidate division CSSED10-310 bacterium TaxID=2855610 RepID=A0ABV6YYX0_UNCC1